MARLLMSNFAITSLANEPIYPTNQASTLAVAPYPICREGFAGFSYYGAYPFVVISCRKTKALHDLIAVCNHDELDSLVLLGTSYNPARLASLVIVHVGYV